MFWLWRPIITNAKQRNCFIYKTLRWRARQVTPKSFHAGLPERHGSSVDEQMRTRCEFHLQVTDVDVIAEG